MNHALGLAKAREVAGQWARQVEQEFDMSCSLIEGKTSDTVEFTRSGVKGRLIVAPDHFDLDAKLGFLLGAFSKTIEREILKNLDDLLGDAEAKKQASGPANGSAAKPARKAAAKAAPKQAAGNGAAKSGRKA